MADEGSKENTVWPLPQFRFVVDFGTEFKNVGFQEVSGLEAETQIIEYRKSKNKPLSTIKMPGIAKYGNVTMKRGIFLNNNTFWQWHNQISMNTIKRFTVLIKLLDENGKVTMQWQLKNAWPIKISATDLKSDGNEVAIDTLEIAHEQLIIKRGE